MKDYWDKRFETGARIWGDAPSISARHAAVLFESMKVHNVLVPGSGYGRHTEYFQSQGFDAEGIEISHNAIEIAQKSNPLIVYYEKSVLDVPLSDKKYDAVYCYNVVHLFKKNDRAQFLLNCYDALNDRGVLYFTVFSELEESFGRGEQTEENTFESKPNRPVHYFTEDDLKEMFSSFEILNTGIIDENEDHGEAGRHIHKLRYILAVKPGE